MLTVVVRGETQLRAALGKVRARLRDLRPAWRQIGATLVDTAIDLAPVATGALVASIKARVELQAVYVASNLIYAGVQNHGWPARNIEGQHFLDGRLLTGIEDEATRVLVSTIEDVARRAGLR